MCGDKKRFRGSDDARVSNAVLRYHSVNVFLFRSLPRELECTGMCEHECECVYGTEGPFSRMNKQAWTVNTYRRCKVKILSTTVVLRYNNNFAIKMNFHIRTYTKMPHLCDSPEQRKIHTAIHGKHFALIWSFLFLFVDPFKFQM